MIVLGLSGGPDLVHENLFGLTPYQAHDSACVLLEDGEVRFAVEEERLNRIKHTNKFPHGAIRFCLAERGIAIADVDLVAYYHSREALELAARQLALERPQAAVHDGSSLFRELLAKGTAGELPAGKLRFVDHHLAHAMSAYATSGFDDALVVTLDGEGDHRSATVMRGHGGGLELLADFPVAKSLGYFYAEAIAFLGYKPFDEYKVMGLAPYGDAGRYRDVLRSRYRLLPAGDFELDRAGLLRLFEHVTPRRRSAPFAPEHRDLAAAVQEALEEIVFHLLRHYREATGERNLCLAGGVAHNCTLNGKLLRSGLFADVFVQPAAHDAGCALGAALCAYREEQPPAARPRRLEHVFWGTAVGDASRVQQALLPWSDFLAVEKVERVAERAARLLADGCVVGWVQGRSEFGPRALGSRSILADPRPAANKERVNRMVKKREGYRPFAPAVLEEHAGECFVLPAGQERFPFMTFVVEVKEERRASLGAVTHVDGTARIQTVARETNAPFWELIEEFRRITGVPMVLNTSFNNDVEPIVDSIADAVVCFLTTGLDRLVVGDYVVAKKETSSASRLALRVSLPAHLALSQVSRMSAGGAPCVCRSLVSSHDAAFRHDLPEATFELLRRADGRKTVGELLAERDGGVDDAAAPAALDQLMELWSRRLVALAP